MPLNRDKIGTAYPGYVYEVSREKIREYAAALGESDPRYFSAGEDCVAPPTFAACFTVSRAAEVVLADPDLGAHPALVHGSQSYQYGERPLTPGDVLECTPRIASIAARGGSEFLTIEVDCRFHPGGEPAVRSSGLFVFLGRAQVERGAAAAARSGGEGT